jgi:uncharacterized protein (DUF433 family)
MSKRKADEETPLGIGYYTVPEAARLVRLPPLNVGRWLAGYSYKTRSGDQQMMPPLWISQIEIVEKNLELGFRDLIELRFVSAFLDAGLGISTIRKCLTYASGLVDDERPFSTRRFQTDGRTIFFEFIERISTNENDIADLPANERRRIIDLKNRQFVFRDVISPTFKDLDFDDDVVSRWRPFNGKNTIVIDPKRAFGQPIATGSGIPTTNLAAAAKAEGSVRRVSFLFDVPVGVVRDAVDFETTLAAA